MPAEKNPGDKVTGATVNTTGSFVMRAERLSVADDLLGVGQDRLQVLLVLEALGSIINTDTSAFEVKQTGQ